MEKHRCKPSLTRCPFRGRNCCRPRSAGHKSSSDTHHDEEPVVRSSAYFYTYGYYDGYYPYAYNDDYYDDGGCYVVRRHVQTRYGWRVRRAESLGWRKRKR